MNGKPILYLDQYGHFWIASTVRELCDRLGYSRASKMYIDKKDGSTVHIGYVVGPHWCAMFQPVERAA